MPFAADLGASSFAARPGEISRLSVTVRNLGPVVARATIAIDGPLREWVSVEDPIVELGPGAAMVVGLELRPPRHWSVAAGTHFLSLRVVPHDASDAVALADASAEVAPFNDHRLTLAEPVRRGRRRVQFTMVLENAGNQRLASWCQLVDRSDRLSGRIDPPSITLAPGERASAVLRITSRRRTRLRRARMHPFEVHAVNVRTAPVVVKGTFIQEPMLGPAFALRGVVAAAIVGTAIASWAGVVRPEISRATDGVLAAVTTTTSPAATAASLPIGAVARDLSARLEVSAAPGDSDVATIDVPLGQELGVSDLLLQNPDGGGGRLVLRRGGDTVYEAALANLTDLGYGFVSPLVFRAGETLSVELDCTSASDAPGGACSAAVTVSGTTTQQG